MKCIEKPDGQIVRTSNERALALVADGLAVFAPKSKWRNGGEEYEGPRESKGKRSIHPPHGWVNLSNRKPRWAR